MRAGGYAVIVDPTSGATRTEFDTFTCAHCNTVVRIVVGAPVEEMGGWCRLESKPVCKGCAGGVCVPFEKKLEAIERRDRLLAAMG